MQLNNGGYRNSAEILNERIAGCESCDLLASKDIRSSSIEAVKKLLTLSKDGWSSFSYGVKAKLAQHRLLQVHLAKMSSLVFVAEGQAHTTIVVEDLVAAMQDFAKGAVCVDLEAETPAFSVWEPTFAAVTHGFVAHVREQLVNMGIIKTAVPDDDFSFNDLALGINEAAAGQEEPDLEKVLQKEMKHAKASPVAGRRTRRKPLEL